MKRTLTLASLCLMAFAQAAWGQTLNTQGVLRGSDGKAVEDGSYSMVFRLYESVDALEEAWEEAHANVEVVNGVYSVELGLAEPLSTLDFSIPHWLGVSVENDGELSPRTRLSMSPYLFGTDGQENVFPSAGNVGVGTTSPSARLDVYGGTLRARLGEGATQRPTSGVGVEVEYSAESDRGIIRSYDRDEAAYRRLLIATAGLHLEQGADASLEEGSGFMVVGGEDGDNLVMDNNEIMARDDGETCPLYLQADGGSVGIGVRPEYPPVSGLEIRHGNSTGSSDLSQLAFQWEGGGYRHAIKTRHNSGGGLGNAIDFYTWGTSQEIGDIGDVHGMTIANGRVGIGTASPSATLEVAGPTFRLGAADLSDGVPSGKPVLESDGRVLHLYPPNDTNGGIHLHDGNSAGGIAFANYGGSEINSYSNLTTGETSQLTLQGAGGPLRIGASTSVAGDLIAEATAYSNMGNITHNLQVGGTVYAAAFHQTSDISLKRNMRPLTSSRARLSHIEPFAFEFRTGSANGAFPSGTQYGVSAQQVREYFPELVGQSTMADGNEFLTVSYTQFVPVLIQALNEQEVTIQAQQDLIGRLEQRLSSIEAQLSR